MMRILATARFASLAPAGARGGSQAGGPTGDSAANRLALLQGGSLFYMSGNYKDAIGPYRKAFDLERADPQLKSTLWRVLVDNLGMSYGITGDLKSAEEVFQYGLTKDPTYPLFHYNLACVSAEKNDLEGTLKYLAAAFQNRGYLIPGEKMPNPKKDESFKRFRKNPQFRKLVDSF